MDRRRFLASSLAFACRPERIPVRSCETAGRQGLAQSPTTLGPADFAPSSDCHMTEEQTTGPYYLCVDRHRSSIAEDRAGLPITLGFRVQDELCAPIAGAIVDIWHCDAGGNYSGFDADPELKAGTRRVKTTTTRFCRGSQTTNAEGIAQFTSIFPGWYAGRTTHIHLRVYLPDGRTFTTQTYFDEPTRDGVYLEPPYNGPRKARYRSNADEGVRQDTVMLIAPGPELRATITLRP